MKILKISSRELSGGAARAAYRLHRGLIEIGVESQMLVQKKESNDPSVKTPYKSKFAKTRARLRAKFNTIAQNLQSTENQIIHSANFLSSGLHIRINNSDVDIVHLHWVNNEMISVREISKIKKPIVWTLHDMWPFSGAEHYDDLNNPERYKKGYHRKNRPDNYGGLDIDRWTWKRKMKYWSDKKFNIVTPSKWLANCARKSRLFKNQNIRTIPNGLNLNIYKPINKKRARKSLNINENKDSKYILFGAMSATSDKRKGFKQLLKGLSKIHDKAYKLLVFGSDGDDNINLDLPITYLGRLDDEALVLAYSAADVMVVPSLQDNLPNTAVESVACGTPVVAFNIGGLPDIIAHKEHGYLAEPYEAEDLANGIEWILENTDRIEELSHNARKKAVETYAIDISAKRYRALYSKIISRS